MATYQSIRELTRGLQQGARLLNDMFLKRKTVAIRYDDALATLDGDENKLRHLIHFGVIVATGDTLELGEVYQRFFEEVLAVNEDINVASVQTYIGKLKLGIDSWLAVDSGTRLPCSSNASRIQGLALNLSFVWDSSSAPMSTLDTRKPPGVKCHRSLSSVAQPFSSKIFSISSSGSKELR